MKTILQTLCLALAVLGALPCSAATKSANEFTPRTTLTADDVFYFEWKDGATFRGRSIAADSLATAIGDQLGLSSTYQPLDATLTALGGLTISSGKMAYGSGSDTFGTVDSTSFGRSLLNAADASALRTLAATGDVYQPLDATLTALGGLTISSGKVPYGTGSDTFGTVDSTSFGRSLLNAADAAALRTLAGVSTTWATSGDTATFEHTVTNIDDPAQVFLNLKEDANNYQNWRFDGGSILYSLADRTEWATGSQVSLSFPHADGRNVGLSLPTSTSAGADAGPGKLAIYPAITGAANKVLAVNSGATGVEWVTASGRVTDADYITKTANSGLSAEFALGSLSTGLLKVTTTTGDLTSITNSSGLAGALSDETGSGAAVFGTSPTISGGSITGLSTFQSSDSNFTVDANGNLVAKYFKINNSASSAASLYLTIVSGAVPSTVSSYSEVLKLSGGALYVMPGGAGTVLGGTVYLSGNLQTAISSDADRNVQIGNDGSAPSASILSAGDGTGTNATGGDAIVEAGNGTGTGGSGSVIVRTASAGSSGSSANTMTERFKIDKDGIVTLNNAVKLLASSGSPEGAITAPIGSLYLRTDGGSGTTLYVKESGTGNTGWVGK